MIKTALILVVELSMGGKKMLLSVMAEKRGKYIRAFRQQIGLYRSEKDDAKVKELERLWQEYEIGKVQKEQHHRMCCLWGCLIQITILHSFTHSEALLFSESGDTDDIPLPDGTMADGAAMTPFMPPPRPPQFHPALKTGILKKTAAASKKHKYPPGPPCGLPPDLSEGDERGESSRDEERRVRFSAQEGRSGVGSRGRVVDYEEEDYGAVESEFRNLIPPN